MSKRRGSVQTLIKNNEAYRRIFNPSYPLELYYKCAVIARACESLLKSPNVPDVFREHANNLRFYVATLVSLQLSGAPRPSVSNVAAVDLHKINGVIESAAEVVYKAYNTRGGNDQVAKGSELEKTLLDKHRKAAIKELKKKTAK